jgi:hypothetical protein
MSTFKSLASGLICVVAFCDTCSGNKLVKVLPVNKGFAVVELFTSEGCSSCPAAEAVLAKVHDEYPEGVYVMEFHVDYWNYIGWTDIYSSPEYTKRQKHYAELFHLGSTYTPQAIVNGKNELVGSDDAKLHRYVNEALRKQSNVSLKLGAMQTVSAMNKGHNVSVDYTVSNSSNQIVNIALVQKVAESNVKRGENSGKKLKHINVVRELQTVDATNGRATFALPSQLNAADFVVIAYTQDKDTWQVTAASEAQ